jgi:hypothetical protein
MNEGTTPEKYAVALHNRHEIPSKYFLFTFELNTPAYTPKIEYGTLKSNDDT